MKCRICNEDVAPLIDYSGELEYHRNNDKEKSIHIVCYPTIPDPNRLCYYHNKKILKEEGLLKGGEER